MIKLLITGAAGLLGSRFAEWVLINKSNVTVIAVDDLSGGYLDNIRPLEEQYPERFRFYIADVASDIFTRIVNEEHPTHIVHLAAYAAECVSPYIRKFNYQNNLIATANVINACIRQNVKRLLFTSSMAVYGRNTPPFSEELVPNPIDPYGIAKYACEMDIQIAGEQHGLDWCIIRPHNVYGKNQNLWDSYRNVIGIFMYKALIGDPITIFGDGLQTRAFSEMTDSLLPLWNALTLDSASKQIINLGGTEVSSILDVANIVKELSGAKLIHLPPRHEVRDAFSTHQKSVDLLGFEHLTSLHDGIVSMWNWAQLQPQRKRFIWKKYEITNGLYEQWKPEALQDGFWKN